MNYLSRVLLLFIASIAISVAARAQDKIYKADGGVIEARVKKVEPAAVVYKRFDNQDGPEYTILKKEVIKIVYQNGTTDYFETHSQRGEHTKGEGGKSGSAKNGKDAKKRFGDNFLSITPAAYSVSVDGSMNDVGIGICYERLLDKHGHIGLNLPILMSFTSNKDFNNYFYSYSGSGYTNYSGSYHSVFFMPGVKFYPATNRERVRYSLGLSLFCNFGSEPLGVYNENTGSPYDTYHYSMFGLMLSNSINITATRHFYMAIDLASGIPFSDNRHSNYDAILAGLAGPFIQFGFKVGYRY